MKKDLVKLRHARSIKDFPDVKLVENEYIELAIRRSPIMLILIWSAEALAGILFIILLLLLSFESSNPSLLQLDVTIKSFLYLILFVAFAAVLVVGLITTKVYRGNKLFVTNKRLIHQEMTSLFSSSTNIIDLISVEDVSFKQNGLFELFFKIGTLRMSTVGEETTYTFKHVDTPIDELELITKLVHHAKEDKEAINTLASTPIPNPASATTPIFASANPSNQGTTPTQAVSSQDITASVVAPSVQPHSPVENISSPEVIVPEFPLPPAPDTSSNDNTLPLPPNYQA